MDEKKFKIFLIIRNNIDRMVFFCAMTDDLSSDYGWQLVMMMVVVVLLLLLLLLLSLLLWRLWNVVWYCSWSLLEKGFVCCRFRGCCCCSSCCCYGRPMPAAFKNFIIMPSDFLLILMYTKNVDGCADHFAFFFFSTTWTECVSITTITRSVENSTYCRVRK